MIKNKKIVDCFPYCSLYGSEMLLLRYNILKDFVDEFIVTESNHTHSGEKIPFSCKDKILRWGLDVNKFKVIEIHTPEDENLKVEEIDKLNCYDFIGHKYQNNQKSAYARTRDRLSKDGPMYLMSIYDDNTIFIHSDIDEIVDPKYLEKIVDILETEPGKTIINIPLVYLQARADLRVYNKNSGLPEPWDWAMFACKREIFNYVKPMQIRSHKNMPNDIKIVCLTDHKGKMVQDMGWHFSWMGRKEDRLRKKDSWSHTFDLFDWHINGSYQNSSDHLSQTYKEGDTPPSGDKNLVLKNFPKDKLPPQIKENSLVKNLLFP